MGQKIEFLFEGNLIVVNGLDDVEAYSLQEHLTWASPLDLSDVFNFFNASERLLFASAHVKARTFIKEQFGKDVEYSSTQQLAEHKHYYSLHNEHLRGYNSTSPRAILQRQLVDAAVHERFAIAKAPPGFGKTRCIAEIIQRYGMKANVVVGNKEPFEQAAKEIRLSLGIEPGLVQGKKFSLEPVNILMIDTFNSLKRSGDPRLEELMNYPVWIIDEAHNAAADSYIALINEMVNPYAVLGVTATPFRNDDKNELLEMRIGSTVFDCDYAQAIDANILVPMYLFTELMPEANYGFTGEGSNRNVSQNKRRLQYQKVVKEMVYQNKHRNSRLIDFCDYAWNEHNATCAIIADREEHIDALCKMDRSLVKVMADNKNRQEIWDQLGRKEITRVATTLMDEATNVTSLGAVAMAAPGLSKVRLVQRQRQLRTFEGETVNGWYKKEYGLCYMPLDQTDFLRTHAKVNLDNMKKLFVNMHPSCMHVIV